MAKKYFWLKLKDDFFNQKEIKMLRKIAGGDTHTIIYLKMLLLSLSNDGRIYYDGITNNMIEEISLEIDEEVENVAITFNYLRSKGLLVFNTDDEIELSNIHQMIGSESASASRVRKHRNQKALQSNNEVTKVKRLSNTEIEIDIELEKEIENIAPPKKSKAKTTRHKYGDYQNVLLSDEDIEKLQKEFPSDWQERIERLSEYCASTGKTYKNYLATIRNWAKRDTSKPVKQTNGYQKNVRREKLPDWAQPGYKPPERKSYDISITEEEKAFD